MATKLTWLGHGCWLIETAGTKILLDPFLDDQPTAPVQSKEVDADYILISHGHFDHVADAASIAKRCGSTIVSIFEIATWFGSKHQIENTVGMNIGGGLELPFGHVKMTHALHSSSLPDGSDGGHATGFVLTLENRNIYFACDTGLFSDMQWIGRGGLDLAVLPIGDLYTMGPQDSVAATQLLKPQRILPAHYNTWEPIAQDANAWAERVRRETEADPTVLVPGGTLEL